MNLRPHRIIRKVKPRPAMPPPVYHPDGRLTISLPIPPREISPNGRRGESRWAAIRKATVIKRHRQAAFLSTRSALAALPSPPATWEGYSLAFYFPTAAMRDDDNADASCKAYRDGIADALRIDDQKLRKLALSTHHKDPACPRVEITLHPLSS